jgi:hypothetical protein
MHVLGNHAAPPAQQGVQSLIWQRQGAEHARLSWRTASASMTGARRCTFSPAAYSALMMATRVS